MVRPALAMILALLVLAGRADAVCRPYLDYGQLSPMIGYGPPYAAVFDAHGIPIVRYPFGLARNPATVAEWGLQEHSFSCVGGGRAHRARALRAARWLLDHEDQAGRWTYGFDWQEGPVVLRAPWTSALGQGRAISLLTRAYHATGQRRYLAGARRALRPFGRNVARRGLVTRWRGHPWYEEYPASNANHVLNGFEIALLGLHDLAPQSLSAARLFAAGVRSLVWAIPTFDGGPTGSYYAAGHFYPVPDGYLFAHVQLTRELSRITHRPILHWYAKRWAGVLRAHGGWH